MKLEGHMEVVFWTLVALVVGTALGMVWNFAELSIAANSGLASAVILGRHSPLTTNKIRS